MPTPPPPPAPPRTVAVTGRGRVTIAPDVVEMHLGVAVTRPTAVAAQADAAATMSAILAGLRSLGLGDRDLRTERLSLQPMMDYREEGAPRLRGYELRNMVVARLRALDRLPEAIDGAIAAGATSVDEVRYDVEDRAAAEAAARDAAVADALAKAEALARAAGASLGQVLGISEARAVPPGFPVPRIAKMAVAEAAATPVEAGEQEIVALVDLVAALV